MSQHKILIESHLAEDAPRQRIGLTVLCECGTLICEVEAHEPQISLDAIIEARWAHWDQDVPCRGEKCVICGDEA